MESIEIKISNKKFSLLVVGCLIFITLSILFIIKPDDFVTFLVRNTLFIKFAGILGLLFFGFALYSMIQKKILDGNIGIIINDEGIIDNSSFVSVGLIKWEDIVSIEKSNVVSTSFLLIKVKDPKKYIDATKGIKSKLLKGNYNSYGTPISISANFINCSFTQLENVILNSFENYKTNN